MKLCNNRGESLVEGLTAVLVFTLASVALFSMILTSVGINREAKEKDRIVQEQLVAAESAAAPAATGTVTMTVGTTPVSVTPVDIFSIGLDDGTGKRPLYSYFRQP